MGKLPLLVTDFLATGLIAMAAILFAKMFILATPIGKKLPGLAAVVGSV